MKILLIEDDTKTAEHIVKSLRRHGDSVDHAVNGHDGLFLATGETYDVLIVDRMLPGLDGIGLVKVVRGAGGHTPVLFLTALDGLDDHIEGFEAGGDDYLVKPFAFGELHARLKALARRPRRLRMETVLRVGDLEFDLLKRKVRRQGQHLDLLPQEAKLLEYLMRHAGEVVTRTMILESVWGFHFDPKTTVVETHISRLRKKVDLAFGTPLIHTVHGSGYSIHVRD